MLHLLPKNHRRDLLHWWGLYEENSYVRKLIFLPCSQDFAHVLSSLSTLNTCLDVDFSIFNLQPAELIVDTKSHVTSTRRSLERERIYQRSKDFCHDHTLRLGPRSTLLTCIAFCPQGIGSWFSTINDTSKSAQLDTGFETFYRCWRHYWRRFSKGLYERKQVPLSCLIEKLHEEAYEFIRLAY